MSSSRHPSSSSSTTSEDFSQSSVSSKFNSATSEAETESRKQLHQDEEIMKRRLIIDGANNDKRLASLTKSFVAFCDTKDEDPRDLKIRLTRLIAQIKQVEFDARKTHAEIARAEEDKAVYTSAKCTVQDRIKATKDYLTNARKIMVENKRRLGSLKQFEAVSKILLSQPDREAISNLLAQARSELNELEGKKKSQENQVEVVQSKMILLAGIFDLMEEIVEEDKELELETQSGLNGPEMPSGCLSEAMEVMDEIITQVDNLSVEKLDNINPNGENNLSDYYSGISDESMGEHSNSFNTQTKEIHLMDDEVLSSNDENDLDETSPPRKRSGSKFSRLSASDGSQ